MIFLNNWYRLKIFIAHHLKIILEIIQKKGYLHYKLTIGNL